MGHRVAVLGASGYAGGELIRLLDAHPAFDLVHLGAHTTAGEPLAAVHPHLPGGERRLGSSDPDDLPEVELVFLALPHGASAPPAARLVENGVKVVDLGADHRLRDAGRYREAYGVEHPHPETLGAWVYGLPELFGDRLAGADRVASPGCYPTAAVLALAPLLAEGLVARQGLVVDAISGVSGAGRSLREDLLFGSVAEGVRAYGLPAHRHRPEMEQALSDVAGGEVRLTFTPHLAPIQRGLLATCSAPLAGEAVSRSDLLEALGEAYREAPFVEVVEQPPQTRWVAGSNRCLIAPFVDGHAGRAVVVAALDNLVKGAAGQAVQNANLMMGVEEEAGLHRAGWMP